MSIACDGLSELFCSLEPEDQVQCIHVCMDCDERKACALEGIKNMWVNEDGRPEAWLVQGGLMPWQLEDLWRESVGGRVESLVSRAVGCD